MEPRISLMLGKTWLALWPRENLAADAGVSPDGTGFRGFSLAHNVRSPTEVDALLSRVARYGGKICTPGHATDWGYFADLDGFLWEVAHNPGFPRQRALLAELAAKYRLPGIYEDKQYVDAGGLMSYGPSFPEMFRRAASYVDRILKGAKPGDLPIEQPTKYELAINLKTANAVGLTIPQSLLLRADHVSE